MDPIGVTLALAAGSISYVYLARRQQMDGPDGEVLRHLKAAGSKLREPHRVDFYFIAENVEIAAKLAADLECAGYSVSISEGQEEGASASVQATATIIPDIRRLLQLRSEHSKLAMSYRATYDGWGAGVVS